MDERGASASGFRERRKHGRASIHLEAVLERTPPEENIGLTVMDFSVGGFFCRTTHAMESGTWLGVTFEFPPYAEHPPRRIEASAVIVRCEPAPRKSDGFQMAACFMEVSQEVREHIQGYVDWHELVYGGSKLALEGN